MMLRLFGAIKVNKRVNPTGEYSEPVDVEKDGKLIKMWAFDERIELTFTLDEIRSILILFDTPESEG